MVNDRKCYRNKSAIAASRRTLLEDGRHSNSICGGNHGGEECSMLPVPAQLVEAKDIQQYGHKHGRAGDDHKESEGDDMHEHLHSTTLVLSTYDRHVQTLAMHAHGIISAKAQDFRTLMVGSLPSNLHSFGPATHRMITASGQQ